MVRTNLVLLLPSLMSALGVEPPQHKARSLFKAIGGEQERERHREVEFGQLQLELSTWATSPRIEKIAREKLKMRTPDPAKIITATREVSR